MEKMRILVANEPCTYREVIADAFRELRPNIEVIEASAVEPDGLEREVARLRPHLVVCSRLTAAVQSLLAWIVLYPDGENQALINIAGELISLVNVEFGHLLSILDKVELLHRSAQVSGIA